MAKMTIDNVTYEGTPEELREIVRTFEDVVEETKQDQPKIGDTVRLISEDGNPTSSTGSFEIGDIGVLGEGCGGANTFGITREDGRRGFVSAHHVEVISSEPTPKTITHEGEEYALVDRKAQAGDIVEFTESERSYYTAGKTYGPITESYGNIEFEDDDGDYIDVYSSEFGRPESTVLVYEKVANAFDKFPKGAKVRLISGGGGHPLNGYENGRIYVVVDNNADNGSRKRTVKIEGGRLSSGYALPEQLELVVDEPLKVGDKVEVIDGSKSRWGVLETGTIGKLTDVNSGYELTPYRVVTDDDFELFPADALRKVTEDEPYEYKVGDIFGYKDARQRGRIVMHEVSRISGSAIEFYDASCSETNTINAGSTRLTLICPAESRVDTK